MSRYSKKDILRLVEEDDVEFIRLQITDIFGMLNKVAITSSQLKKALDNQGRLDGAAIEGLASVEEPAKFVNPELDTWEMFPGRHG